MDRSSLLSTVTKAASLLLLSLSGLSGTPACADGEFKYQPTATNLPLYSWQETGSSIESRPHSRKGIVLLVHGLAERTASLHCLADQLAQSGFLVYGIDLRGHGWWHFANSKHSKGYWCNFKQSVEDVDTIVPQLSNQYPQLPIYLIGESMGAAVVLRAANDAPSAINGLVLAGTGNKRGHYKTLWLAEDFIKDFYRVHHEVSVVRYQRLYATEDSPALEECLNDPEQRKGFTLYESMQASRFIGKNLKMAKHLDPQLPVLVLQGTADKTLKPDSASKVYNAIPGKDKDIVLMPGCGHILLGTPHLKPLVADSIVSFLEDTSGKRAVASGATSSAK